MSVEAIAPMNPNAARLRQSGLAAGADRAVPDRVADLVRTLGRIPSFQRNIAAGARRRRGDPRSRGVRSTRDKCYCQPWPADARQPARHLYRRRRRLRRRPQPQRCRNAQSAGGVLQRHLRHRLAAADDHLDRHRHRARRIPDLEHGILHRVPEHRARRAIGAGSAGAGRACARRRPNGNACAVLHCRVRCPIFSPASGPDLGSAGAR